MTRTIAREIAVQLAFAAAAQPGSTDTVIADFFDRAYYSTLASEDDLFSEYPQNRQLAYIRTLVQGVSEKREELDGYISKYAKGWKLNRISRITRTILRCAMYEILYMDDVPDSAAVNEALELAKGYEESGTISFINGILGSFLREKTWHRAGKRFRANFDGGRGDL
jgi:N utilization substance protein B